MNTRLPGWDIRLRKVLDAAADSPYVLGENDCFRLACSVVEALTGIDRWPEFSGYKTKRESLLRLARYGSSFEAAGDWFFGERVDLKFARRGDIAAFQTEYDMGKHLMIVMGKSMFGMTDQGLKAVPLSKALCAWKVGW